MENAANFLSMIVSPRSLRLNSSRERLIKSGGYIIMVVDFDNYIEEPLRNTKARSCALQ